MNKAIQVTLEVASDTTPAKMVATCMGERTIERDMCNLPDKCPAYAIARLMCHLNDWSDDLAHGLLPNGDDVFCFRCNRG